MRNNRSEWVEIGHWLWGVWHGWTLVTYYGWDRTRISSPCGSPVRAWDLCCWLTCSRAVRTPRPIGRDSVTQLSYSQDFKFWLVRNSNIWLSYFATFTCFPVARLLLAQATIAFYFLTSLWRLGLGQLVEFSIGGSLTSPRCSKSSLALGGLPLEGRLGNVPFSQDDE